MTSSTDLEALTEPSGPTGARGPTGPSATGPSATGPSELIESEADVLARVLTTFEVRKRAFMARLGVELGRASTARSRPAG